MELVAALSQTALDTGFRGMTEFAGRVLNLSG